MGVEIDVGQKLLFEVDATHGMIIIQQRVGICLYKLTCIIFIVFGLYETLEAQPETNTVICTVLFTHFTLLNLAIVL